MHAKVYSATTIGVDAHLVQVEVDLAMGIPKFHIVGLPDTSIKESSKRILSALKNCGFRVSTKVITANLAPADLKKEGTLFDLPIAIAILLAGKMLEIEPQLLEETLFLGELSLDGSIVFIKGALAIAYDAKQLKKKRVIVPKVNAAEAALIDGLEVIGVDHVVELIAYLRKERTIEPTLNTFNIQMQKNGEHGVDFSQVKGQYQTKRALQISA